ncbi:MAG TPA: RICIN domain-containing protein, partial [Steroidobacteraceae bacterium]
MNTKHRTKLKSKLLAGVALTAASFAAHATEVAPYFYTWGFFSNSYVANSLANARKAGVGAVTLAFGVSGGGCTLGGGLEEIMNDSATKSDVKNYIAGGGRVILSFGGADGQYLESACSATSMYNLIKNVIDTQKIYNLDFDVEGGQLDQTSLNTTRNTVLKQLQAAYPNLYVSFTLPVDPDGLPSDAMTLLKSAKSAGVNINIVNIMTMDYGTDGTQGRAESTVAIASANGTFKQLKSLYPNLSTAQIWGMIGITPMIGYNDDSAEIFKASDATAVTNFAIQHGVGLLSYWALQRDQVGTANDLDRFSRVNTSNYQFYNIMAASKTVTQPVNGSFPAGTYTMKVVFSGKCVDVDAASTAAGANVQQYTCNGTGAQSFQVVDEGSGWYKILNTNSGKAVDVTSASTANGANVQQYTDNGTGAQRFSIVVTDSSDPTAFSIMNENSSKCLDDQDWSTADRGNIQ